MKESCELAGVFAASPKEVYDSWLSGAGHTAMTGGKASARPEIGADFTAWDGYISGKNLELEPGKRIVQSWRTSEFDEADEDSRLEIQLSEVEGGCEVRLIHTNIPEGQSQYEQGWVDHYFHPMREYFGGGGDS